MNKNYTPALKDDLAKIYNFMVRFDFPMTAHYVWVASRQTSGIGNTPAYCEKFINELEEVKAIAEAQPTTTLTYKELAFNAKEELVEVGEVKTWVHKTYDANDMVNTVSNKQSHKFSKVLSYERKTTKIWKYQKSN